VDRAALVSPEAEPVVIDPGHAFGTGAPARRERRWSSCNDLTAARARFGCGSGVARSPPCGSATPIFACDIDPLAVAACAQNHTERVSLQVSRADARWPTRSRAPLWIANLQRDLLERRSAPRPAAAPARLRGSGAKRGRLRAGGRRRLGRGAGAPVSRHRYRFFAAGLEAGVAVISDDDRNHLRKVLRMGVGDTCGSVGGARQERGSPRAASSSARR
jgi:hypothetical protein